jgi:tetratricopeptide (TPR) repeat protein
MFKLSKLWLLVSIVAAFMLSQGCVPPQQEEPEEQAQLTEAEKRRRDRDCAIALSNGWEYYKNREFASAIRNYHRLVDLGCGEEYASDLYLYFGRAYLELSNLDSAVWAYRQGLRYLPDNTDLLKNIAYAMGRQGDVDQQINYLYQITDNDLSDTEVLSDLADLLRKDERWDDLISVLQQWKNAEPDNARVQSDLIAAFEAAGRDPLQFMRDRWISSPENAQWGIDYARKLIEDSNYTEAITVLESVIQRHATNVAAYRLLANTALDNDEVDRAIEAYEGLYQLNRTDPDTPIELSKAYIRKSAYPKALEWAETALRISGQSGEAYYNRGELYYNAADECTLGREDGVSVFADKLVFNMAYEDYIAAFNKGYRQSRKKADFLEKNLIPTKGDWFLQEPNTRNFSANGECYSWITRTITRP